MTITIRPSTAEDAEAIGQLAAEFQEYLRSQGAQGHFDWDATTYLRDGFGADPAFAGLVAEVDATVVGFAIYHFGYDTDLGQRLVYLVDLFVAHPFRGSGIGEALLRRTAAVGRSRGAEVIVWSVLKGNASAVRFYERLGARYVDEVHQMWAPIELAH